MDLSLAVAAKAECDTGAFFDALDAEGITSARGIDVHIAHDTSWHVDDDLRENIHFHACPENTSILKLWGIAIAHCKGKMIAVLDIKCPPSSGWLKRAILEIKKNTRLFFGPVNPGWSTNDINIVGYLTEYAQFRSPLADDVFEVPGNNVICERSLFDDVEKLETQGFYKTFMIWRLVNEGITPRHFDDMAVSYHKPFTVSHYMKRRLIHGRCFAACRFDNVGQPPRLLCLGFTPFLPVLRTWRIYKTVRQHADLAGAFLGFLPLIFLSESFWSLGEFLGYAVGGKHYCDRLD